MVFEIPGPPVAKQRPRRSPDGHWYTPQRTKEYEQLVAQCAMVAGVRLEPDRWYSLEVTLYLSSYRRDRDNILKSIMDGLQQLDEGWDDRQISDIMVRTVPVGDAAEEKAVVKVGVKR